MIFVSAAPWTGAAAAEVGKCVACERERPLPRDGGEPRVELTAGRPLKSSPDRRCGRRPLVADQRWRLCIDPCDQETKARPWTARREGRFGPSRR
jgi:hypothetical protein